MYIMVNIVAIVVTLLVLDQGLEIEVGQFVHDSEQDVFEELVVELGRLRQDLQVTSMLGHAAVRDHVVVVVCGDHVVLQPVICFISDETLAALRILGTVHLSSRALVRAEFDFLSDRLLKERTVVVHSIVFDLATDPLVSREGCLVDVHDLVPCSHQLVLLKLLGERSNAIAGGVLSAELTFVHGLEW